MHGRGSDRRSFVAAAVRPRAVCSCTVRWVSRRKPALFAGTFREAPTLWQPTPNHSPACSPARPTPFLSYSWIVKQSVGTTPVLLGQKLTTRYFRGELPGWDAVAVGASKLEHARVSQPRCPHRRSGVAILSAALPHRRTSKILLPPFRAQLL